MSRHTLHVVQLRFTPDEWSHISAIARLRELTIEELLREELRMSHRQPEMAERARSHLRLLTPGIETDRRA
jgi:hypothetical protein